MKLEKILSTHFLVTVKCEFGQKTIINYKVWFFLAFFYYDLFKSKLTGYLFGYKNKSFLSKNQCVNILGHIFLKQNWYLTAKEKLG